MKRDTLILIIGARCTGKTTLELNLREAVLGDCKSEFVYTDNGKVCFIGKTANKFGRLLATGGSERIKEPLLSLPNYDITVATVTPGYDKAGILNLAGETPNVYVFSVHTDNRKYYYRRRTKHFSKREPIKDMGPAKPVKVDFKYTELYTYRTENLHLAYVKALKLLSCKIERKYDVDILCRTIFQ